MTDRGMRFKLRFGTDSVEAGAGPGYGSDRTPSTVSAGSGAGGQALDVDLHRPP